MGIWNLPNKVTLGRLVLAVGLFAILACMDEGLTDPHGVWSWIAFALFAIAAGTDWLDGWLARRYGMVTAFGRIMDPFVDKVVVCGAFIFLATPVPFETDLVAPWMVVVIIGREFFVSAIRGFMESKGVDFGADMPGKIKMFVQCIAIGAILLLRCLRNGDGAAIDGFGWAIEPVEVIARISVWLTLITTLYSGFHYARKARAGLQGMDA